MSSRALFVCLLCALLLVGCSNKVSYRFLDWIVAWSVDDYVSWDDSQQRLFDQQLDALLNWHQLSELPLYSQQLRRLQQDFEQPLTQQVLYQQLEEMTGLWHRLLVKIEPDAVLLLATLSDDQVTAMRKNLDQATLELEKKYIHRDLEKIQKERIKNVEKWVGNFIGRLSKQQRQLIVKWNSRLVDSRTQWIANRKQWVEEFDQALQQRHQENFVEQIHRLFVNSQTLWSDSYQQKITTNTEQGVALIIALQKSLSDRQRQRLSKELQQWIQLFDELAAETATG